MDEMSKTRTPLLDDDLFPLEDTFAERFAGFMARSDEQFMNEINARGEQFMKDLEREHDQDISDFLERVRQDPNPVGNFTPLEDITVLEESSEDGSDQGARKLSEMICKRTA